MGRVPQTCPNKGMRHCEVPSWLRSSRWASDSAYKILKFQQSQAWGSLTRDPCDCGRGCSFWFETVCNFPRRVCISYCNPITQISIHITLENPTEVPQPRRQGGETVGIDTISYWWRPGGEQTFLHMHVDIYIYMCVCVFLHYPPLMVFRTGRVKKT